jgi:hypothetical protein
LRTCYKQIVFSHIKRKKKVWLSENNPRGGPSAWVAQEEAFFFSNGQEEA